MIVELLVLAAALLFAASIAMAWGLCVFYARVYDRERAAWSIERRELTVLARVREPQYATPIVRELADAAVTAGVGVEREKMRRDIEDDLREAEERINEAELLRTSTGSRARFGG